MQNEEAFFALSPGPTTHSPEASLELFGLDNEEALKNPTSKTADSYSFISSPHPANWQTVIYQAQTQPVRAETPTGSVFPTHGPILSPTRKPSKFISEAAESLTRSPTESTTSISIIPSHIPTSAPSETIPPSEAFSEVPSEDSRFIFEY